MSEDDAFRAAIQAEPFDDLRRLVYADWLDEHDRPVEAEYLRLVAALAASDPIDPTGLHAVRLLEISTTLPVEWREQVAARFDLWADGYGDGQKIPFIKGVRQITNWWLLESKRFAEALPKVLSGSVRFEEAVRQVGILAWASPRCRIRPSTANPPAGLMRLDVVVQWYPNRGERVGRAELQPLLDFLRHALADTPGIGSIPEQVPLPVEEPISGYAVTLMTGLSVPDATRTTARLHDRLFGGRAGVYATAVPRPFPGVASVCTR